MLSQSTAAKLSALTYRNDAKREVCLLPLGGIYWNDEMPDIREFVLIPEEDRNLIFRLFGIRVKHWREEMLTEDEQRVWDATRSQVPTWAFWDRQRITVQEQQAQIDAERDTTEALERVFADADEVSVTEKDGVQSFSATFKLREEPAATEANQPFWKRILRKLR